MESTWNSLRLIICYDTFKDNVIT